MASSFTAEWLHLTDDETVVWASRPHPVAMGVWLPVGLALAFVGFTLTTWGVSESGVGPLAILGAIVTVLGATAALVRYVFWTNTRYVITSNELYKKHGVVSRDVTQFRLDRVQNTSLQQSAVGRLLGYGTLTIYTAGSGEPELTFEQAPRPGVANGRLNEQLEDAMARPDGGPSQDAESADDRSR